jgi:2-deoxy-D-gluconate 3-dehydrogenase
MSSQMGTVGYPGRAAYCATKHAVNGLTKALAVEWAPHRIAVNAVAPTFVETPMTKPMLEDAEFAAEVARRIPGGEIASLEDVAAAVLYLSCDRARAVTGHVLAVDAGWTAW